jgi:RNA polymerase sigma factor (TIGR02999 family)
METPSRHTVTRLLQDVSAGHRAAFGELLPLVYAELRLRAARHLRRERPDHTLQATALVNEAYLRLVDQHQVQWQSRAHFFAIAAQAMRRILVDHARRRHRAKRDALLIPLDHVDAPAAARSVDLVALDEALERLAGHDSRQAEIIQLRFFGGLSIEETAEVTGVSPATVKREWVMARAWLYEQLQGGRP